MFAACSETDVLERNIQQNAANDGAVKFDVYAQRNVTRGGGQTGDLTNANIGTNGFGVFAYYTNNKQFDQTAQPNFMYNQQVTCDGEATEGTLWKYEPVKYWPNEFGAAAISDDVDYVSFFAYAPYTKFVPETGEIDITGIADEDIEKAQKFNIISVNKNTATGDPIIKYVVDTDPATSVDLLWGVAAENAAEVYTPISGEAGIGSTQNKDQIADPGMPFVDMVKPNNPSTDRLRFNLKHALAKVKFTIDYIADAKTPGGEWAGEEADKPETFPVEINAKETRIFVRSFKIDGWATEGALNLNNTEVGKPLWKAFDGVTDLTFGEVTFFDGRKDGKEATTNGEQKSEKPLGLNKNIIEVYGGEKIFGDDQNDGVTKDPQLLFDYSGDADANGGYFYVIPRGQGEGVNVTIEYNVETIDSLLAGKLADGVTHGSSIENVISKENIFGENVDFEPGYQYWVKIHIGMTSVKIEATVEPWVDNGETEVDLPDNQDPDPEAEGENENKPSIEGGSTFTVSNATYKGETLDGELTLTVDDEPEFIGSYVKVTVSGGVEVPAPTADNPDATEDLGETFYVNAYKLKNGEEVELLILDEGAAPSRKFEGEEGGEEGGEGGEGGEEGGDGEITAEGKVFQRTGVFVVAEANESE